MQSLHLFTLAIVFAVCCLPAAGCGRSGPERVTIAGTVVYQGQPVESGRIRFLPAKGTNAPMSGGNISKGRYVADALGGVPVGTYRVEITAERVDPRFRPDSGRQNAAAAFDVSELPKIQYIPERYNTKSELTLNIPPGSGKIEKNFEL